MNLINAYLQEVERRLPEKNRDDILLEIRSTIEDMLPTDPTEEDVKKVLQEMGDPVKLAHGYSDKPMHLIGPRFYDTYISIIKMILQIAITISLISLVAENIFRTGEESNLVGILLAIVVEGIWRVLSVGMQVFFWVTVIFAIIERVDIWKEDEPVAARQREWKPDDLKKVAYVPKKRTIPRREVYGSLLWTAVWASVYFNANRLLGIYENPGEGLIFITPAMNQDVLYSFWPAVVLVIGLEIGLALYKLLKKEWTRNIVWYNAIQEVIATIIFVWILSSDRLFQPEFITYISNLFNVSTTQVENSILWGAVTIFITIAIWNIIEGFIKYKQGLSNSTRKKEYSPLNEWKR